MWLQPVRKSRGKCSVSGCVAADEGTDEARVTSLTQKMFKTLSTRTSLKAEVHRSNMKICDGCRLAHLGKKWAPPSKKNCFCCHSKGLQDRPGKKILVGLSHVQHHRCGAPVGAKVCPHHHALVNDSAVLSASLSPPAAVTRVFKRPTIAGLRAEIETLQESLSAAEKRRETGHVHMSMCDPSALMCPSHLCFSICK